PDAAGRPGRLPAADRREVGVFGLAQPRAVAQGVGHQQVVAVGGEVVGEERARRVVVLDEQDRGGVVGHAALRGRRARTRAGYRGWPVCWITGRATASTIRCATSAAACWGQASTTITWTPRPPASSRSSSENAATPATVSAG